MIVFENRGQAWKLDADPETERRVARAMGSPRDRGMVPAAPVRSARILPSLAMMAALAMVTPATVFPIGPRSTRRR